jgi:hypothetical protein
VYSGNWLAFVSCSGYHPSKPTKPEIPEKQAYERVRSQALLQLCTRCDLYLFYIADCG